MLGGSRRVDREEICSRRRCAVADARARMAHVFFNVDALRGVVKCMTITPKARGVGDTESMYEVGGGRGEGERVRMRWVVAAGTRRPSGGTALIALACQCLSR